MVLHFFDIPTSTARENETTTGKPVEARYRFSGHDRVSLWDKCNASADLKRASGSRSKRQRDKRIVGMRIALRQLAAPRIR